MLKKVNLSDLGLINDQSFDVIGPVVRLTNRPDNTNKHK